MGIPPPFSYLFCRHSLAGAYFDNSVIQKVQETTYAIDYLLPFGISFNLIFAKKENLHIYIAIGFP